MVNADFTIAETGALKGKLIFTREGYDATRMRSSYYSKGEETYVKEFVGSKPWKIDSLHFANISAINEPAKETYKLEIEDHASVAGDNIYISPFVTSQIEINPYKSDTRVYPVDYGSQIERTYFCRIKAPEGYVLDEKPESKILTLPGNAARYIYNVAASPGGDWISITSRFQINQNIFLQEEYLNLREFYNQVVSKQSEQVVFKKKI